ncbi:MAG: hypothetical protein CVV12_08135 [Gammaproteobacteria bacterium HGW-Gammaproteobacteria-2]|nr:MAG: hypothetical protein CVV12_08135 [Gammaproteobacteria bacterium HGW-Gammaproteobacteria-2]
MQPTSGHRKYCKPLCLNTNPAFLISANLTAMICAIKIVGVAQKLPPAFHLIVLLTKQEVQNLLHFVINSRATMIWR